MLNSIQFLPLQFNTSLRAAPGIDATPSIWFFSFHPILRNPSPVNTAKNPGELFSVRYKLIILIGGIIYHFNNYFVILCIELSLAQ